jgi:hypothetical protein
VLRTIKIAEKIFRTISSTNSLHLFDYVHQA